MSCCSHCQEAGELFTDEKARKELREYRRNGAPNKPTRLLIDGLKTLDLSSTTLLDVGGGVGMIQHELLEEGLQILAVSIGAVAEQCTTGTGREVKG